MDRSCILRRTILCFLSIHRTLISQNIFIVCLYFHFSLYRLTNCILDSFSTWVTNGKNQQSLRKEKIYKLARNCEILRQTSKSTRGMALTKEFWTNMEAFCIIRESVLVPSDKMAKFIPFNSYFCNDFPLLLLYTVAVLQKALPNCLCPIKRRWTYISTHYWQKQIFT